jgi:hypothetical protein
MQEHEKLISLTLDSDLPDNEKADMIRFVNDAHDRNITRWHLDQVVRGFITGKPFQVELSNDEVIIVRLTQPTEKLDRKYPYLVSMKHPVHMWKMVSGMFQTFDLAYLGFLQHKHEGELRYLSGLASYHLGGGAIK